MGMVASSVLFYFWLCLSICGAIQFRSEIMKAVMSESDDYVKTYNFLSYVIYYFLVLMQLLLACFADKPPLYVDDPVSKVSIKFNIYIIGPKILQKKNYF